MIALILGIVIGTLACVLLFGASPITLVIFVVQMLTILMLYALGMLRN